MATPRRELVLSDLRRRIHDLEAGLRERRAGVLPAVALLLARFPPLLPPLA